MPKMSCADFRMTVYVHVCTIIDSNLDTNNINSSNREISKTSNIYHGITYYFRIILLNQTKLFIVFGNNLVSNI